MTLLKETDSAQQAAANRRIAKRNTLVATATLWPAEQPDKSKGRTIWIFNISMTGIAFRANQSVRPASICYVTMETGPFKLASQVRIAWQRRREDGTFEAGAEFLQKS